MPLQYIPLKFLHGSQKDPNFTNTGLAVVFFPWHFDCVAFRSIQRIYRRFRNVGHSTGALSVLWRMTVRVVRPFASRLFGGVGHTNSYLASAPWQPARDIWPAGLCRVRLFVYSFLKPVWLSAFHYRFLDLFLYLCPFNLSISCGFIPTQWTTWRLFLVLLSRGLLLRPLLLEITL